MFTTARHITLAAFAGFAGVATVFSVALRVAESPSAEVIGMFRFGLFGMVVTGTVLLGMILIHRVKDQGQGAARIRG